MIAAGLQPVWRIVKSRFARGAFSGEGARLYGGRWNSPGRRLVYTSQSAALAVLEILVHLDDSSLLTAYSLIEAQIPAECIQTLVREDLPANWQENPAPPVVRQIGDKWIEEQNFAVLAVPSVIIPQESNYLINPAHADFARIVIGNVQPFDFDVRLMR